MTLKKTKVLSGYKDIANFLGVSTKTIQRNLKYIPVSRLGTKVMILESDLVEWIRENIEEIKIKKLK
ncbi:MAG: helix-turn-helix domain-containing protein, partial [Deltaproteobacteria bacterium]|nr:helix-turn-helix domain-containing protein [Deltaproteobacteria bacterium]